MNVSTDFFRATELAKAIAQLHDLGKCTIGFQQRLEGKPIRAEHAVYGALMAIERYGDKFGTLLAYIIAGHHTGLSNGESGGTRTPLQERLTRADLTDLMVDWQRTVDLPEQFPAPTGFTQHPARVFFQLAFLTRMLFSSLIDADRLDTENFYNQIEGKISVRGSGPSLTILRDALDQHLQTFPTEGPVNQLRANVLHHVRQQATLTPGLFSLTVPTGGGKTLTSLAFALDHALQHSLRRIIYVAPYTSIIEQNAQEFRAALGEYGEHAVLEHHSTFEDDNLPDNNTRDKLRAASENWDIPIVVTTAVQFFESLFASSTSRCRKLHNIAGCVIILDEAQTLPLNLLHPCVAALDELARNYHCSIVLCTATQPALKETDDPQRSFKNGLRNVRELTKDPQWLYQQLERVSISHIGEQNDEALAERLRSHERVLCIVNNRRHARALFEAIQDKPGARHLSTLMCAKHRKQVLAEIRENLKAGRPCRLISTSLIEAGVNLDFPYVLRAEAGLDAIAQAAGRCNREGKRNKADSHVHIFRAPDWPPPPELNQYAGAMQTVIQRHSDDPLSLAAIDAYFRELYWQKGDQALDKHNILGLFHDGQWHNMPFDTVSTLFRLIDSVQRPIIVPFDDTARKLLRDLEFVETPGTIARRLQPYIVQVPMYVFETLDKARALQAVNEKTFGLQFVKLVDELLYDQRVGLAVEVPAFINAMDLVPS